MLFLYGIESSQVVAIVHCTVKKTFGIFYFLLAGLFNIITTPYGVFITKSWQQIKIFLVFCNTHYHYFKHETPLYRQYNSDHVVDYQMDHSMVMCVVCDPNEQYRVINKV